MESGHICSAMQISGTYGVGGGDDAYCYSPTLLPLLLLLLMLNERCCETMKEL